MYRIATSLLSRIPRVAQEWIHKRIIAEEPMRFDVQPGSLWLAYPAVEDAREVLDKIPPGMTWNEVSIFPGDTPGRYIFFNFFRVETPYFSGHRLEVVTTIADGKGETRFLILDYFSDAISSDPEHLFRSPTHSDMEIVSDYDGLRMWRLVDLYRVEVWTSPIAHLTSLDTAFSVDANCRIYYAGSEKPNILEFNPDETGRVVVMGEENLYYLENHLWVDCREADPVACFMYANPISFTIRPDPS